MKKSGNSAEKCPYCRSGSHLFYRYKKQLYHQCDRCKGIFRDVSLRLGPVLEKVRYLEHNNDVEDPGYQKFVSPVTQAIFRDFSAEHTGLDFGAGPGPVIAKMLSDNGYQIALYDPYFHNFPELLEKKYDYIVCCEVMEHFNDPGMEFNRLKSMLRPEGKLYCMTDLYDEGIDFHKWYYRNDLTHVFIYHRDTIELIRKDIGFSSAAVSKRLIVFSL